MTAAATIAGLVPIHFVATTFQSTPKHVVLLMNLNTEKYILTGAMSSRNINMPWKLGSLDNRLVCHRVRMFIPMTLHSRSKTHLFDNTIWSCHKLYEYNDSALVQIGNSVFFFQCLCYIANFQWYCVSSLTLRTMFKMIDWAAALQRVQLSDSQSQEFSRQCYKVMDKMFDQHYAAN